MANARILEDILAGVRPYKKAAASTFAFFEGLAKDGDTLVDNAINLVRRDGTTGIKDINLRARADLANLWSGFTAAQKADGIPVAQMDDNFRRAFAPMFVENGTMNTAELDEFYKLTRASHAIVNARMPASTVPAMPTVKPSPVAMSVPAPKVDTGAAARAEAERVAREQSEAAAKAEAGRGTPPPPPPEPPRRGNRDEPSFGGAPANKALTEEEAQKLKVAIQKLDNTARSGSRMTDQELVDFSTALERNGQLQSTGTRRSVNSVIRALDEGQAISPAELRDLKQYHAKWAKADSAPAQNLISASANVFNNMMARALAPISGMGHMINRYSPWAATRNPQGLVATGLLTTTGLAGGIAITDSITGDNDPTTPSLSEQTTLRAGAAIAGLARIAPGGMSPAQEYYEQTMRYGPARANEYLLRVAGLVETVGPDGKKVIAHGPVDPANQDLRNAVQAYITPKSDKEGSGSEAGLDILPSKDIRANTLYFLSRYGATDVIRMAAIKEIDRLAAGNIDGQSPVTTSEQAAAMAVKAAITAQASAQEAKASQGKLVEDIIKQAAGRGPETESINADTYYQFWTPKFNAAAVGYTSQFQQKGYDIAGQESQIQSVINDSAASVLFNGPVSANGDLPADFNTRLQGELTKRFQEGGLTQTETQIINDVTADPTNNMEAVLKRTPTM